METPAFLGQADLARIAIEQSHADPRLQARDGPAHP